MVWLSVDEPADRPEALAGLDVLARPVPASSCPCPCPLLRAMTASGGESKDCGSADRATSTLRALVPFFCFRLRVPKKRDSPLVLLLVAWPVGVPVLLVLVLPPPPRPPPSMLALAGRTVEASDAPAELVDAAIAPLPTLLATLPTSVPSFDGRGRGEGGLIISTVSPSSASPARCLRTQDDEAAGGGKDGERGDAALRRLVTQPDSPLAVGPALGPESTEGRPLMLLLLLGPAGSTLALAASIEGRLDDSELASLLPPALKYGVGVALLDVVGVPAVVGNDWCTGAPPMSSGLVVMRGAAESRGWGDGARGRSNDRALFLHGGEASRDLPPATDVGEGEDDEGDEAPSPAPPARLVRPSGIFLGFSNALVCLRPTRSTRLKPTDRSLGLPACLAPLLALDFLRLSNFFL